MPTLYIDVYFLINFTVDAVALYLAARMMHLSASRVRLILSAAVGGISACLFLFLPKKGGFSFLAALWILLSFLLMALICAKKESLSRIFRFGILFLLSETAIGGAVYCFYGLLERYLAPLLKEETGYRRKFLLAALLLFLSSSLVKLGFSVFGREETVRCASVTLTLFGKSVRFTALIDSGNLAEDPMSRSPVLFVKADAVKPLLPFGFEAEKPENIPLPWKARLRLIPYETASGRSVAVGFLADSVLLTWETRRRGKILRAERELAVPFAIDASPGDFGGFSGLLPASLIL